MLKYIPEVTEDDQWDNVWVSSVTKKEPRDLEKPAQKVSSPQGWNDSILNILVAARHCTITKWKVEPWF